MNKTLMPGRVLLSLAGLALALSIVADAVAAADEVNALAPTSSTLGAAQERGAPEPDARDPRRGTGESRSGGGAREADLAALPQVAESPASGVGVTALAPDWEGLKHDTAYFMFYQLGVIGILYVMPEDISGWSEDQKQGLKWTHNVRHVVWDTDDWWINYGLHPYWGAAYYVRARDRGYNAAGSFWYSVALSTIYEFGAEAFFEEPSAQDIVVTPVLGSFLGYYFVNVRERIRRDIAHTGRATWTQRWVLGLTDPLGALNSGINSMFGRGDGVSVMPFTRVTQPGPEVGSSTVANSSSDFRSSHVMGLQLRIDW